MPKILQPCFPGGGGWVGYSHPVPAAACLYRYPARNLLTGEVETRTETGPEKKNTGANVNSEASPAAAAVTIRYCTYIEGGNRSEANGVVFSISTKVQTAPPPPPPPMGAGRASPCVSGDGRLWNHCSWARGHSPEKGENEIPLPPCLRMGGGRRRKKKSIMTTTLLGSVSVLRPRRVTHSLQAAQK